ncbi:MAG TPA: hypothetical protein VFK06_06500 [Candidatus Angelobacter sp.]|nr:hypothetical protein [Candidatus Angelobacter sp.]
MKDKQPHLSHVEEAQNFARVMIESWKSLSVPELMVLYAAHITAERDMWRKAAEDLSSLQPPVSMVVNTQLWKQVNSIQEQAEACITMAWDGAD